MFKGLSDGKKAVDVIQKDLDIDDMQDLQDEIAEQVQAKEEIDNFFVKHAEDQMEGLGDELDELEAEMAALEMEADAPVAVGTITVPGQAQAQPAAATGAKQKSAEDELAAMMAM